MDPLGLSCWVSKNVVGRKVFQRDNLIDAHTPVKDMEIVSSALNSPSFKKLKAMINDGATNKELMAAGYAPFGPDGRQINLHHLIGKEPGTMVELTASFHKRYHKTLHGLIENGNSFRNNRSLERAYNLFRTNYWKTRAMDF